MALIKCVIAIIRRLYERSNYHERKILVKDIGSCDIFNPYRLTFTNIQ